MLATATSYDPAACTVGCLLRGTWPYFTTHALKLISDVLSLQPAGNLSAPLDVPLLWTRYYFYSMFLHQNVPLYEGCFT